ncbi:hypothetical protein NC653_015164 [Populus alba x Populus x berolinensis]|uniref:Uncharacterized protein n=1 Tax=Populus alba x Populus x berolinensis TaxID=444605 RepID=A0AAD6VY55_9ROSI|nr:hypothetical protein NC653_015164 [Populus alba x Populus x berolinensis]
MAHRMVSVMQIVSTTQLLEMGGSKECIRTESWENWKKIDSDGLLGIATSKEGGPYSFGMLNHRLVNMEWWFLQHLINDGSKISNLHNQYRSIQGKAESYNNVENEEMLGVAATCHMLNLLATLTSPLQQRMGGSVTMKLVA